MANLILVDTDILIDAGRGLQEAIETLQTLEQKARLAISVVTQMELLVGCRNKAEQQALEQFLRRFHILKIDETISDKAVELLQRYRLSHGLLIADALIAATALCWECAFISKNQRDYRFIESLHLLPYP
ncbi:MAG: type II toxin-antitoxin system VapC family toxin [Ardenticatenia bacterium]|nr:MAG: type II toxin-antitoxin system VapC family toxin [Ardenticatenia bacterium]